MNTTVNSRCMLHNDGLEYRNARKVNIPKYWRKHTLVAKTNTAATHKNVHPDRLRQSAKLAYTNRVEVRDPRLSEQVGSLTQTQNNFLNICRNMYMTTYCRQVNPRSPC